MYLKGLFKIMLGLCSVQVLAAPCNYTDLELLRHLHTAYPDYVQVRLDQDIDWFDGSIMDAHSPVNQTLQEKLDHPSLIDQLRGMCYEPGFSHELPNSDPGRIRYEPFFRKMYGDNPAQVENKLVTIVWMPKTFGNFYLLRVTTVNNIDKKLINISHELDELISKHPEYINFVAHPGGTYQWRFIAHTSRLSMHSFGMTIDLNADASNYWQWDLELLGQPIEEDTPLNYQNNIPWEIVKIFEKYHFIWGGKWQHYDSMHFEYRPELYF